MAKGTLRKLMRKITPDSILYATVGFAASALITLPFLISNSIELNGAHAMAKTCASQSHDYQLATHHTALAASAYASYDDATFNTEVNAATEWISKAQGLDCRP